MGGGAGRGRRLRPGLLVLCLEPDARPADVRATAAAGCGVAQQAAAERRRRRGGGSRRGAQHQLLRAAVGRRAVLPQRHGWRNGLGPLLRVLRPLLGVVFGEAVHRRRTATTKLLQAPSTESMFFLLLSDFRSRMASRMRHSWLCLACGPLVVRAPRLVARSATARCSAARRSQKADGKASGRASDDSRASKFEGCPSQSFVSRFAPNGRATARPLGDRAEKIGDTITLESLSVWVGDPN